MNAKNEFLTQIENKKLVCARIGLQNSDYEVSDWAILKHNYTNDEFNEFLEKINFSYDSGYGGQELFGVILFDNSFSDRGEYDGSEWWENHKMPTIEEVELPS